MFVLVHRRIQKSHSELSSKFASLEVEAKLKESEAIPLFHEKQRLQTELDSVQAHAGWLEQELEAKGKEYQRLLQESRDRQLQLQTQLQHTENEKISATAKNAELNDLQNRLHDQVEKLTEDLKKKTQEMIHLQETTELEVQQERRYVQQQQEQLSLWEQRYNDAVRENQSLKAAAARATEATEHDVDAIRNELKEKYEKLLKDQAAEYEARITQKQPSVAALPTSEDMDEDVFEDEEEEAPMGMTELFERLEKKKSALREMTRRARSAEILNQRLFTEINDRTPSIERIRSENELAMQQIEDLQRRLESAISEKEGALAELDHSRKEQARTDRRYAEQVAETKTLAGQVQALLTSRASGAAAGEEFPTSVAEMQQQNQRLLRDNRELEKKVSDLEQKLKTDELRAKLSIAEQEIREMVSERKKQEQNILKIVQQRDIYRSLCKLDASSGSDGREITIEDLSRQQAEKTKELETRLKALDGEVSTLTGEKDRLVREKEAMEERLLRSETNRKELMDTVSTLQSDIYRAKGDLARQESDASYFRDKLTRTEESLQRSVNEVSLLGAARTELQRINAELQHSLTAEKDRVSRANSLKEQAETKLRRALAEVETTKASERRVVEDNAELRREVARQGTIIDSIRRIETSLSAKSAAEVENLKEERYRLLQQHENDRKKLEADIENLRERVRESEARTLEADKAKSKAENDLLDAKKTLLAMEAEKRAVVVKCESFEVKLRAANKKLGISDESDEVDVSLESRVEELSGEVEKYKEEIAALEKSVETYKKIARDSEKSFNDLSIATEQLKKNHDKDLKEKAEELESISKESSKRQEMIIELTKDLSKQQEEAQQIHAKLKGEIAVLKVRAENFEKDTESAKAAASAAALDLETLRSELSSTQDNYERELKLHSQARSTLRSLREQVEEEVRMRQASDEKVANLNQALVLEQEKVQKKTDEMMRAASVLEERLKTSKSQNEILHSQLESLNQMVEKLQRDRISSVSDESQPSSIDDSRALEKQAAELREVVKYLRSDNEMIQSQLDTAKRSIDREKAAGNVLKSSLEEVRAELKALKDAAGNSDSATAKELEETKSKLIETEDQLRLLRDSNKVLREDCEKSKHSIAELNREISVLKEAAKPLEKAGHDAGVRIAQLESEKESLVREVSSWKSRVESLVSKFNQIDPEVHRKALKRADELEKEKEALEKWKTTMEKENTRIREIARRLKQSQTENNGVIESQKKEIEKLKEEKSTLSKVSSASNNVAKERDALKEKVSKLEKDAESTKTELEGANSMNGRLRERLRQFQNTIRELRAKEQAASSTPAPSPPPAQEKVTQAVEPSKQQAPESASKTELTGRPPQIPEGGFKYGPSVSSESAGPLKSTTGSTLRVDAASFTPSGLMSKKAPPATSKQDDASTKPLAGNISGSSSPVPEPQSKSPTTEVATTRHDSSATKEMSYKEKLLEKKRKLADLMKRKAAENKAKTETSEEQGTKKAKLTDSSDPTASTTEPEKPTATKSEQEDKVSKLAKMEDSSAKVTLPGEHSRALVTIAEEGEQKTEISAGDSETEQKKSDQNAAAPVLNPFASVTSPFGSAPTVTGTSTISFGQPSSLGGGTPTFGSGGSPAPFGSAAPGGSPAPNAFGAAAPSPATQASGSFGSSFLNIKPPGSSAAPTFSFGSSSKPIVLPTPTLTAPAPSPFGAFGGTSFGSGATFSNSFGSPAPQAFGSRPLFGAPQQDTQQDESKKETPEEGETKEKGQS